MKSFLAITILAVISLTAEAQKGKESYLKGVEKAREGDFEAAIKLFSKAIKANPEDYYAWYNRGIANSIQDKYEQALPDFDKTIELAPDYKKGWLNRGITRKHLTDYKGAIADYTHALKLDPEYCSAHYNLGLLYELHLQRDTACYYFQAALDCGMSPAQNKVEECDEEPDSTRAKYAILKLEETATDDSYGYNSENPIMVGAGHDSGPGNQHRYLRLLRDPQGNQVSWRRRGSCCGYESPNGFMGTAMLDIYEITYRNKKGKKKTTSVYISFYDYETPKVVKGFFTAGYVPE